MTLDHLSFISFGNEQVLLILPGSTLTFHFGTADSNGAIPFTFGPEDLSIAPIPVGNGTLHYTLASPVSGYVQSTPTGRTIAFNAEVKATLLDAEGAGGTYSYSMPFTTESTEATNLAGTMTIEITGMRLVEGAWYVQLVGATVNQANAFPKPGTAVCRVLSGQFDQMP